jgi:alpha-beta hydrolase superfamily lysophospholipase
VPFELMQSWTWAEGHRVHAFEAAPVGAATALVVLLPGLGLTAYTRPTAEALARRGVRCAVLDVPGFGTRMPRTVRPDVEAIGEVAAEWVRSVGWRGPLAVAGHSTGAQAALTAALCLQEDRPDAALVMAGPTFDPSQRRLAGLLRVTPLAYRRDSWRELCVLPQLARGRSDVAALLRSGLRDRPERRVARLRLRLVVTAGRYDAYSRPAWLRRLSSAALLAPHTSWVLTPGSHNNLFTHAAEVSDVVLDALTAKD